MARSRSVRRPARAASYSATLPRREASRLGLRERERGRWCDFVVVCMRPPPSGVGGGERAGDSGGGVRAGGAWGRRFQGRRAARRPTCRRACRPACHPALGECRRAWPFTWETRISGPAGLTRTLRPRRPVGARGAAAGDHQASYVSGAVHPAGTRTRLPYSKPPPRGPIGDTGVPVTHGQAPPAGRGMLPHQQAHDPLTDSLTGPGSATARRRGEWHSQPL